MMQSLGLNGVYTNMIVLSATQSQNYVFSNTQDLESSFHGFLRYYQPEVVRPNSFRFGIITEDFL
ncbi:hypothetical protein [Moraxella cuniculi]|nr:hypothetical protein [Moraxella cuniculi]